jgi:2-polyprenyl-6-methoxyphenol hydroxylase-like FAD-dependent oxidoreductase
MNRNHAVVIGGSISGLVAARVLSRHFQRVTLVERDVFPAAGENRRGVPQGRHTHGLLAGGRNVLETLFPGLGEQLMEAGALSGDLAADSRWFHEGGCLARPVSGLNGLLLTRPMLEGAVRKRVLSIANLTVIEDASVEGLLTADGGERVTGVRLVSGDLTADLVVDASGRGSKSPDWLTVLGYAAPPVDKVEVALGYTTRFFRRHSHHLGGDLAVIIPPTPTGKRGGVMVAQEGGRWTVTLLSHFGPVAPGDLEGFRAFAEALPAPFIHEVIGGAEPIGEPFTSRFPASVRRRYERLTRFPEGYLVFGDAICSFNPIYGQGMTVAALESMALEECLLEDGVQFAARFFRKASRIVDIPWSIAVGNDLRMVETGGTRGPAVRFINWYISKLHRAAHHDPALSIAFHRVANLLAPPPTLLRPANAWRVLRGSLFRRPARNSNVSTKTRVEVLKEEGLKRAVSDG